MKNSFYLLFALNVLLVMTTLGQSRALTFQDAEKQGIPFQHLDSLYKSAVHDNAALAVFKSPEEQEQLMKAYSKLLQDLGSFLKMHNFKWEQQTKGFNRIYFKPDGRIDYFLFNFPPGQVTPEKQKEFTRLLSLFIQDYKFALETQEKFAQCSPVRYSDI